MLALDPLREQVAPDVEEAQASEAPEAEAEVAAEMPPEATTTLDDTAVDTSATETTEPAEAELAGDQTGDQAGDQAGELTAEATSDPATDQAAAEVAEEQAAVAPPPPMTGIHDFEDYLDACEAAGAPDAFQDSYVQGYTSAAQWEQSADGRPAMSFGLKVGNSASQAVKDFLSGLTVANYNVIAVALELDAIRDELGDDRFDELFGSSDVFEDAQVSSVQRLQITGDMYGTAFGAEMRAYAARSEELEPEVEPDPMVAETRVEETPEEARVAEEPAPEMIAEELGVLRQEEFA